MDIENSGILIAGLIPWSIACSIPLAMLGAGNGAHAGDASPGEDGGQGFLIGMVSIPRGGKNLADREPLQTDGDDCRLIRRLPA